MVVCTICRWCNSYFSNMKWNIFHWGFLKKKKKEFGERHCPNNIWFCADRIQKSLVLCRYRERESERAIERETMRRIKKKINRKNIVESIQVPCLYFQYFMTVEKYLSYFFPHLSYWWYIFSLFIYFFNTYFNSYANCGFFLTHVSTVIATMEINMWISLFYSTVVYNCRSLSFLLTFFSDCR